jgi:hypothetical protein
VHDVKDLERVLARVISLKYAAFSGRRSYPKPNEEVAGRLIARAREKILLHFGNVDAMATSVPIHCIHGEPNINKIREFADDSINPSKERLVFRGDRYSYERVA